MGNDLAAIEGSLTLLLSLLSSALSWSEAQEVRDFVDVGEYGLALETLVDIVTEEEKSISAEALRLIIELADSMRC
ncbi:MafI family immunity protein [Candidatus Thiodictyon syntrophicum]|jgi:hypothetical protein|uniref:MafI family immunity protein n=1 Tax=Candidatus Thiodictyon syntrophicum TaxID=1166950 RepID=A0A2K8UJ27_9GAMM|nr:MafI family immunity protein [Candidatus Thiodictyon syntrophicum]AUB85535.1 hypothetical protein THSYN_31985 [Candidatus Thiodictyon syntrophicum]